MSDEEGTSHLAEEQWERERKKLFGKAAREDGGARSGPIEDRRVTAGINWVLGGVGTAIVWVIWHFGSQFSEEIGLLRTELVKTNTQLAISIAQNQRLEDDVKDHEARLRANDGDIRDIKARLGMNLRSGPEPSRGH